MDNLQDNKEILIKMIVCGEIGCGKTMFVKRLIHGLFSMEYKSTIGVDFGLMIHQPINSNITYRIQMWDIAGTERFGNMLNIYLRDSTGALVIVDTSRISTFEGAQKWCYSIKNYLDKNGVKEPYPIGIIFNKYDMIETMDPEEKENIRTEIKNCVSKCKSIFSENTPVYSLITSTKTNISHDITTIEFIEKLVQDILSYEDPIQVIDYVDYNNDTSKCENPKQFWHDIWTNMLTDMNDGFDKFNKLINNFNTNREPPKLLKELHPDENHMEIIYREICESNNYRGCWFGISKLTEMESALIILRLIKLNFKIKLFENNSELQVKW